MPNIQHLEVFAGESRVLVISGRDASNAVAPLTGRTVSVYIGRGPNDPDNGTALLTRTATISSTTLGTVSFTVTPSDTESWDAGNYRYQAKSVSGSTVSVIALGRFRVNSEIF